MSTPSEAAIPPASRPTVSPAGLNQFRHAHWWLIIALVITVLGFTPPYFMRLGEATWQQHLHGLSAMLWMLLVVIQPWLATHGKLVDHRRFGRIALILSGLVVASALGVLPGNIENAVSGETPPFVPSTFFYGITFLDIAIVSGFVLSIIMATLTLHRPRDHALWMISTVFWILSPGFARFVAFSMVFTVGTGDLTFIDVVIFSALPILAVLTYLMIRLRQAHPALLLAFAGNCTAFLVGPVGNNAAWRALTESVFLTPGP